MKKHEEPYRETDEEHLEFFVQFALAIIMFPVLLIVACCFTC